jgi:hypothetical protein
VGVKPHLVKLWGFSDQKSWMKKLEAAIAVLPTNDRSQWQEAMDEAKVRIIKWTFQMNLKWTYVLTFVNI